MDELLAGLISLIAEVLGEVLVQVVVEALVALIVRAIRNVIEQSSTISPILAVTGYFLLGIVFGFASPLLFPHPLFHPSKFHGISLLISPVITGLVMSQVGGVLRRNDRQADRIENFGYGFTFALGMAIIRFVFVR